MNHNTYGVSANWCDAHTAFLTVYAHCIQTCTYTGNHVSKDGTVRHTALLKVPCEDGFRMHTLHACVRISTYTRMYNTLVFHMHCYTRHHSTLVVGSNLCESRYYYTHVSQMLPHCTVQNNPLQSVTPVYNIPKRETTWLATKKALGNWRESTLSIRRELSK